MNHMSSPAGMLCEQSNGKCYPEWNLWAETIRCVFNGQVAAVFRQVRHFIPNHFRTHHPVSSPQHHKEFLLTHLFQAPASLPAWLILVSCSRILSKFPAPEWAGPHVPWWEHAEHIQNTSSRASLFTIRRLSTHSLCLFQNFQCWLEENPIPEQIRPKNHWKLQKQIF